MIDLFLDSGAFSAWTKGAKIDLDDYAAFIVANRARFSVVANLDVIPGRRGHTPTTKEIEKAAEEGWENWETLTKKLAPAGIVPLHTYHRGEDPKWLRRLMDHAEYFGIGGLALGISPAAKRAFLDDIMPLLTDRAGWPLRKLHGFGLGSLPLLQCYPWYSVDSSSWSYGRYGHCFLVFGGRLVMLTFGERAASKLVKGTHVLNFSKVEQKALCHYIEARGFTVATLAVDWRASDAFNIRSFIELETAWVPRPFSRGAHPRSFFPAEETYGGVKPTRTREGLRIYLAGGKLPIVFQHARRGLVSFIKANDLRRIFELVPL